METSNPNTRTSADTAADGTVALAAGAERTDVELCALD
jgi:hypothetical protein